MTDRLVLLSDRFTRGPLGRALLAAALAAALTLLAPPSLGAQTGSVSGRVTDAETAEPISQVLVELVSGPGRTVSSATTGEAGAFRIAGIAAGRYSLVFSRIAYETRRLDGVSIGAEPTDVGSVTLVSRAFRLNPIVVTASRREEKALEAPARVEVVDRQRVEERPATTAVDHVRDVPGTDIVTTGLAQHNVVARGFNNVFSGALFVLTDNRWASVPSLRFNAYNLIPATDEDIERIEFVLGPGSALYGPNVDKGVMHIISRSPLETQETTLSITGGEREIVQAAGRHAGRFSQASGYKISGLYFRGRDWPFTDPAEAAAAATAQACLDVNRNPGHPACLPFVRATGVAPAEELERIGVRDFDAERFAADARLDFGLADDATLTLSGGFTQMVNSIEMTGIGAALGRDWRYTYAQARLRYGNWFAQSYINWSDAGETFLLRTGRPIIDNSLLYVGQVQHQAKLSERQRLIYGVDFIRTEPSTDGSIHGRNEDDDNMTEIGGYLQSETRLSPRWDFVAAGRIDHHNRVEKVVVSPRAALVFKPTEGQNLRATYNRAFSQPSTVNLFLDILASPFLAGPAIGLFPSFPVRASGVPETGFTFRRDCGAGSDEICMRSPFAADPNAFMAVDVTAFWDTAVAELDRLIRLKSGGADSLNPALKAFMQAQDPTGQVATDLRRFNLTTLMFDTAIGESAIVDVARLKPSLTNTFEVGYKGLIGDRLLLGVDVYYTRVEDFVSPLLVETPNAVFDSATLAAWLDPRLAAAGVPPANREQIIATMSRIPLGLVTPEETPGGAGSLLLTYRNFGTVDLWGADLGASLIATNELRFSGTYSFVNRNFIRNLDGISDVALNAPRNKATLSASYRSERLGLGVEVRGRYVETFPVNSGVYVGRVDSYELLDANVSYALPFSRRTEFALSGTNVLDQRHRQMVGAPEIGRMLLFRLRQTF